MSIALVRMPEDIEQGAKGGPTFNTAIVALSSGAEQRNAVWEMPLAVWDVGYGISTKEDYSVFRSFFLSRGGRQQGFLFKDWTDYEAEDEPIGTGNGRNRQFIFYKTYMVDGLTFQRRITRPVANTVVVMLDGVVADSATYTLGTGGWISFDISHRPADGVAVTWTGEFDTPVRFNTDTFQMVAYLEDAGEIDSLPIIEVRDPINAAPTAVNFIETTTTLQENVNTASATLLATIDIVDDPFGTNVLTLSGPDAGAFVLGVNSHGEPALFLAAGVALNFELQDTYQVTVTVDDASVTPHPAVSGNFTLTVTDINEPPSVLIENATVSLAANTDTTSSIKVADITVIDDGLGVHNLTLSGSDRASFAIVGSPVFDTLDPDTGLGIYRGAELHLRAGVQLGKTASIAAPMGLGLGESAAINSAGSIRAALALGIAQAAPINLPFPRYSVNVLVDDPAAVTAPGVDAPHPCATATYSLTVGVVAGVEQFDTPGDSTHTVRLYTTLVLEMWGAGAGAGGVNSEGHAGGNTSHTTLTLTAHGGKNTPLAVAGSPALAPSALFNAAGGVGGVHTAAGDSGSGDGGQGGNGVFSGTPNTFGQSQTQQVTSGKGGNSPAGGAGGAPVSLPADGNTIATTSTFTEIATKGLAGTAPGGGGSGPAYSYCDVNGANQLYARPGAGAGEYFRKVYVLGVTAGAPTPGTVLHHTVGAGGAGGDKGSPMAYNDGPEVDVSGGDGAAGRVRYTWS